MRACFAVVMVVVGCDSGAKQADCPGAASAIVSAFDMKPGDETTKVRAAIVARCADDKWTTEAASCIRGAKTADAIDTCTFSYLTQQQQSRLDESASASSTAAMAKMAEFGDRMCACKDAECAKRLSDEMTKWSQEMAGKARRPPKMSETQIKQATEIGTRMGECMQRAMGMDTGAGHGNGNVE